MVELQELTPDDWPTWRTVRLAALADAPYAFGSRLADWQVAPEDRWRARLGIPNSVNFVAFDNGEPVGMASGVPTPEIGVVELISMWVKPSLRGQGLGGRLVEEVVAWAKRRGARVVRLGVADGNAAAIALYRRCGFQETGEVEIMPDGVHRELVMERPA